MKQIIKNSLIIILVLLSTACNGFNNGNSSDHGVLEEGYGGVAGRITNLEEYWPGKAIYIYAAHFYGDVEGEGSFILEPSTFPRTEVEDDGTFQIINLPPRKYVFIVGPNAESGVILGGKSTSSIVTVVAGEIIDLGDFLLNQ